MATADRFRGLAWLALPLLAYAAVVPRLWFNAPIWDDYDTILGSVMRLQDAQTLREWLGILVAQHNEHRIAVMRLVSRLMAAAGEIDFRVLTFVGNLAPLGTLVLAWREFRDEIAPPLFAAAGFLVLQVSYFEASLMASGALPNLGVVFFSFAGLFFALRPGAVSAACCVAFALLAVGSQANGLFVLPLAAAAAMLSGKRTRALVFASIAVVLWILYFSDYRPNPGHPSPMEAIRNPLVAAQLFVVVVGGLGWSVRPATVLGLLILTAIAWFAYKRIWKQYPVAAMWIAFVLISAAAATAGRAGWGVFHASRYAIYSTCLVLVLFLLACATAKLKDRRVITAVVAGAALANVFFTWMIWPAASAYSARGQHLAEIPDAAPELRRIGIAFPHPPTAERILDRAAERRLYFPPRLDIKPPSLGVVASRPEFTRSAGHVDHVLVEGTNVVAMGWFEVPATVAGRSYRAWPAEPAPRAMRLTNLPRPDVATALGNPDRLLTGFRLEIDYGSEAAARTAAPRICLYASAPGLPDSLLVRQGVDCGSPK